MVFFNYYQLFISKAKICDNEKNTSDIQNSSEQFKFQFFERNKTMFEELIVLYFKINSLQSFLEMLYILFYLKDNNVKFIFYLCIVYRFDQ